MYDRGIEAFLAIASCHSISGAAELICITQSAVSHRLRELEIQLGMTLVDRRKGSRRSDLTLAGEKFFPIAERWRRLWHETEQVRSDINALSLNIGVVESVNIYLMPPIYMALIANNPPVHLKISTARSVNLYEPIERRELDVAFVGVEKPHQHVKITPFYREAMQIVRHRKTGTSSRIVRAKDLDPTHELFFDWGPTYQIWHDRIWGSSRVTRIELYTASLLKILLDRDPIHWAIAPKSVTDQFRRNKRLIVQQLDPPPPDRSTFMITHQFPRIGAQQGIQILESQARNQGFLSPWNKDSSGGEQE